MRFGTLTATLILVCAASIGAQPPSPQASASQGATAPARPAVQADYVVGAQDVLVITLYDEPELSGDFTVQTDGSFAFPLLGRVEVGGMTLRQTEASLRQRLVVGGFFKAPQVSVAIEEYRSRKIFVLGEVRKPGVHALSGAMRLVEALALADSTLPTAAGEVVIIPANEDPSRPSTRNSVRVSLRDLEAGDASLNVVLKDGDTILVPRAEDVYVFGQVRNPGAYAMHDDDMTVLQALSLAGGVTDRGATGRIEIVRVVDGERQEISAALTDTILPGDTIVVPQRYF
jgi:polysaccharide export outer membrane protein